MTVVDVADAEVVAALDDDDDDDAEMMPLNFPLPSISLSFICFPVPSLALFVFSLSVCPEHHTTANTQTRNNNPLTHIDTHTLICCDNSSLSLLLRFTPSLLNMMIGRGWSCVYLPGKHHHHHHHQHNYHPLHNTESLNQIQTIATTAAVLLRH